ncbi:hypothetical protein [Halorubrum laminariae]|uniref:Uncharacterized protein n=1 Tax=Halorubrum laminariae TaxID=1433523 RepID=A0ABD6C4F3_9EURY
MARVQIPAGALPSVVRRPYSHSLRSRESRPAHLLHYERGAIATSEACGKMREGFESGSVASEASRATVVHNPGRRTSD